MKTPSAFLLGVIFMDIWALLFYHIHWEAVLFRTIFFSVIIIRLEYFDKDLKRRKKK